MDNTTIKVLLIEDDPMVQEVNKQFIERIHPFNVIDVANNGIEGLKKIEELQPDLVILDIFMPSLNGIETLYEIRKRQIDLDVIIISAANDQKTIRKMIQNGAYDYLIKPFKFERLKQSLEQYHLYRKDVHSHHQLSQAQLDKVIFTNEATSSIIQDFKQEELPKGLNKGTLLQVIHYLKNQIHSLSAEEVADGVGIARVTARRYLEFLTDKELLELNIQYGNIGRPIHKYSLIK